MNFRTPVVAAMVALCLGVSAASAQGIDLRYPVAYDDRSGPVYYQNTVYYGSAPSAAVNTGYAIDPAPAYPQPAPVYTPPARVYTPPAPTYPRPAPAYRPPATVYCQAVAPAYTQPCYARQSVVARYTPTYVAYTPRVAYSPTYLTAYNVAAYQAPAAAPVGPRVWVHPKVYVEGQPIRNLIKAITP